MRQSRMSGSEGGRVSNGPGLPDTTYRLRNVDTSKVGVLDVCLVRSPPVISQ